MPPAQLLAAPSRRLPTAAAWSHLTLLPLLSLISSSSHPNRYVHRVGRTARLGQRGAAALFLLPSERAYIEHLKAHGVAVHEQPAVPLLNAVLGADRKVRRLGGCWSVGWLVGRSVGWFVGRSVGCVLAAAPSRPDPASPSPRLPWPTQAGKDLPLERHQGAYALQKQLMEHIAADRDLTRLGGDAFRCGRGGRGSGCLATRRLQVPARAPAAGCMWGRTSRPLSSASKRSPRAPHPPAAATASHRRSWVRAYATHATSVKSIFHVRRLHLGHVAHAFALK